MSDSPLQHMQRVFTGVEGINEAELRRQLGELSPFNVSGSLDGVGRVDSEGRVECLHRVHHVDYDLCVGRINRVRCVDRTYRIWIVWGT